MTISQGFGDVRARARQGLAGDWAKVSHLNRFGTALNQAPQSRQVTTTVVSYPGDSTPIVITINGVDVTYTTGVGGDVDTAGQGLADAINGEPLVRGQVTASYNAATNTLTLTANLPGRSFTVAESDAALATPSTTAAATADEVPFARAVISQGYSPGEVEELGALAKVSRFTAQRVDVDWSSLSGTADVKVYEVRGGERALIGGVAGASLTAATAATELDGAMPPNSVAVTDNSGTLEFLAEVAGLEFEVEISSDSVPTITQAVGPSISTSFHRGFLGVSMYSSNDEAAVIAGDAGRYAPNAGIRYAEKGDLWVDSDESPSKGGTVYVELADGADAGKLFTTSSATRLAVGRGLLEWQRDGNVAGDSLAVVRIGARE